MAFVVHAQIVQTSDIDMANKNGTAPEYLCNCIEIGSGEIQTRHSSQQERFFNKLVKNTLNSIYCQCFIQFPSNIREAQSADTFLTRIKKLYVNECCDLLYANRALLLGVTL